MTRGSRHRFHRGAVIAWLGFAAAPTFAAMALLTGIAGDSPMDLLCQPSREMAPLGSMTTMYLLMAVFHASPWLRRVVGSRRGVRRLRLSARPAVPRASGAGDVPGMSGREHGR